MFPFPKIPNVVPGLVNNLTGHGKKRRIKGTAMVMKKNTLDFNDVPSTVFDNTFELFGQGVTLQLISSVHTEHTLHGVQGKRGKPANLKNWIINGTPIAAEVAKFKVAFDHEEDIGIPEAFSIRNNHRSEFFLKDFTLENVPGADRIHFVCNSWVYPASKYKNDRVFFANKTYLPSKTPVALRIYRERELVDLRGDGKGELKEGDRVYDYAYYNDLGDPDCGPQYARPILGGSSQYPYPRRGRTGRPRTKTDPKSESRLRILKNSNICFYVPRDERFGNSKMSDFLAYGLKSVSQSLRPALATLSDMEFDCLIPALANLYDKEFDSFQKVLNLYEGGFPLPKDVINQIGDNIPFQMMKEIFRTDGENMLRFPVPQVIKVDKYAWRTDEEFGREMLAGVNPIVIRRLQKFPPQSNLDPKIYGDHTSTITEQHIGKNLDGLTVDEAIKNNKLFILDHHDHFMPYLRRINDETKNRIYGTRTLLFLRNDGTLKPVAIELSLPYPDESDDQFGCISKVYTPGEGGVESSIWQLAKAYVAVNDCGFHQIISHWLNTHAVIEPFVIATNRQLSVLHPIHKLLDPHFRDTMNINAAARQVLVNANGLMEKTFFPGKYAMELSSAVYKNWVFPDQALPADLIKRGVAVKDANSPHGLRLLIEDYPYAVDGLQIWFAIRTWVKDYCSFYYKTDGMIQEDTELQSWWKELVEKGHGDKKHELWWPKMQTIEELIESCTIIIWIASALHAAVNFGQYPFAGYIPNRPTVSRRFMPEEGTPEYEELKTNPDLAFLKTINSKCQSLLGISLVEILSRHSSDEIYLGQRDSKEWTADSEVLEAFKKFGVKLTEIEHGIMGMNNDEKLKNRAGPVKLPYTLLYPTGEPGLSGKGIPNSISI